MVWVDKIFGLAAVTAQDWRVVWLAGFVFLAVALGGCAAGPKRPVFYPNSHLDTVGKAQARHDVDVCMGLATEHGVNRTRDGEVGKKAAGGAVLGGVGAGVWGLFRGNAAERALAGAAAGAATGATKGAIDSTELNATFKRFVERCLRDRGYDLIGWE